MKLRTIILSFTVLLVAGSAAAQSSCNPLNLHPATVSFAKNQPASQQLTDITFYRTDNVPFDRTVFAYNESGQKKTELMQRWDASSEAWNDISKEDYSYRTGKITVTAYRRVLSEWQVTSTTDITCNSDGRKSYSLKYQWNKETGTLNTEPSERNEWNYDANGRLTEYIMVTAANAVSRILYIYNSDGAISEELYQTLDNSGKIWTDGGKYVYQETGGNSFTATSLFPIDSRWVSDGRIVNIFNDNGSLVRSEYYSDETNSRMSAYSLYSYGAIIDAPDADSQKALAVYPNPVTDVFDVAVDETLKGSEAKLFDASGTLIKSLKTNSLVTSFDVSTLPAGVYFLKVGDLTRKIIKK
ncbi:MAG: T9SS type A sorting domain-containing protein [Tannerella sp.]|jgi:hypothetical protein|nr:T9SS type A sorting domain-containing protein [Tannerella sp.]